MYELEVDYSFPCSELDELPITDIPLSVPLVDEVIQVGTKGPVTIGKIIVSKPSLELVTVSRTDGTPIQASILTEAGFDDETGRVLFRSSPVLKSPIDSLHFKAILASGSTFWRPEASGLQITDPRHMERLAYTIAGYALRKASQELVGA